MRDKTSQVKFKIKFAKLELKLNGAKPKLKHTISKTVTKT